MNRIIYSNALNLEIANAAANCKTGQEIQDYAKVLSNKYDKKLTGIVTKIYLVRRKAGIAAPRKQRKDANPYMPAVTAAKIEKKVVESDMKMKLNFTPSRVEICTDHIKLYF